SAIRNGGRYGIVRGYGGHGIGTAMHQDPHVLNYGRPGKGPRLVPGLALAIEPMLTLGSPDTAELADGWTVITRDRSIAVHVEHTVAFFADGVWVTTAEDGGAGGGAGDGGGGPAAWPPVAVGDLGQLGHHVYDPLRDLGDDRGARFGLAALGGAALGRDPAGPHDRGAGQR